MGSDLRSKFCRAKDKYYDNETPVRNQRWFKMLKRTACERDSLLFTSSASVKR